MGIWTPGPGPTGSDDQFVGDMADDTATGLGGNDTLSGMGGADNLSGGDGNDIIYGHSAGAGGAITAVTIASGITGSPATGAATSADAGFLYIVSKDTGVILRVDASTGASSVFLDIPNGEFLGSGERGVLGMAFHPDYASNGRFFVYLTDAQGDLQIREYHRSAGDPTVADAAFTIVIEIPKQTGFSNHNGGWIGFSPVDGYLYIATGDGGGAGDPGNNAQDLNDLLGKIIRIDVNGDDFPGDVNRNYHVPNDNPFVGVDGLDEIWAYGVRNPWRNAFDPRNGDFYIADVGQGTREEVNFQEAGSAGGLNYGWRIMEGTLPFAPGGPGDPLPGDPSLIAPVYEYGHNVGVSITGGEVYVGPNGGMTGHYVFADYDSNRLFSLYMNDGVATNVVERTIQLNGASLSDIVDFVTGTDGNLYAIGLGGTVWRLDFATGAEDVGDTLDGGAGDDQLFGGVGNDVLIGGTGIDTINGGTGNDTITYAMGDGNGVIDGGDGTDTMNVSDGAVAISQLNVAWDGTRLTHVAGNALTSVEVINAAMGGNTDWLNYTASSPAIVVNLATGVASGFNSISGIEVVVAGNGNDTLTGDGQNNRLDGRGGNDTIVGGNGGDNLIGGDGDDVITGGLGNDVMNGDAGNDTFYWNSIDGRDTLHGGTGFDTLYFTGDATAELGFVTYDSATPSALMNSALTSIEAIHLDLAGGIDWLIYTSAVGVTVNLVTGMASGFASIANIERVIGGSDGDTLIGNDLDNRLDGAGGSDTLNGGAGSDIVLGGDAVDTIYASAGNDSLQGGNGNDTFIWTFDDGRDTFNGGADIDTVNMTASAAADVADVKWNGTNVTGLLNNAFIDIENINMDLGAGGPGGDWIRYDTLFGISVNLAAGTASGFASITNVENIIGGLGWDTLIGDTGANKVNGNDGDDTITGGGGADNLTGGNGNDTFVYAVGAGADTINDFDAAAAGGQDMIDVSAFGINAGNFASRVTIIDLGADTLVRIDGNVFITLKGVSGNLDNVITDADFIFGP